MPIALNKPADTSRHSFPDLPSPLKPPLGYYRAASVSEMACLVLTLNGWKIRDRLVYRQSISNNGVREAIPEEVTVGESMNNG